MMNKKLAMAMGLVLAGTSAMVSAEENSMGLEFSANVAMTSDYVFRGISQNEGDPAIQGGFDVGHSSGVYAGVWASNVSEDLFTDSSMELDTYLGWGGEVGPVGVDVGWLRYNYPGAASGTDYDTDEYHIGVSGEIAGFGLGATYYYSSDFFGTDDGEYWDLSAEYAISSVTLAAHYGMTDFDANGGAPNDYDDWSIGASTELGGFGFDLTYTDTDVDTGQCFGVTDSDCDSRVVFTISKSL
jgi:uncharacterized protein (TIGR02001 family)